MSENQWSAPATTTTTRTFTTLIQGTISHMTDHFLPFMLSGVLIYALAIPIALFSIVAIYGGLLAGALLAFSLDQQELAGLWSMLGAAIPTMIVIVGSAVVAAPLTASLHRAMESFIEDDVPLDVKAPLRTATENLSGSVGVVLAVFLATFIGSLFCLIPGILAGIALSMAPPLVYNKGYSVSQALRASMSHCLTEPSVHLKLFFAHFIGGMIAGAIPVVGTILLYPFIADINYRVLKDEDFPAA